MEYGDALDEHFCGKPTRLSTRIKINEEAVVTNELKLKSPRAL